MRNSAAHLLFFCLQTIVDLHICAEYHEKGCSRKNKYLSLLCHFEKHNVEPAMLRVVDVDYIKDYELLLKFSDGAVKKVDLRPFLTGEVFGELLDKNKFVQYALTPVTIEWANGADLAPEFLYEIGTAA